MDRGIRKPDDEEEKKMKYCNEHAQLGLVRFGFVFLWRCDIGKLSS